MTKAISIFSCANELYKIAIKRWRIARYGSAMGLLWACFGYVVGLLWACYGPAMGLLWVCYGPAMGLIWACYVGPYVLYVGGDGGGRLWTAMLAVCEWVWGYCGAVWGCMGLHWGCVGLYGVVIFALLWSSMLVCKPLSRVFSTW